MRDCLRVEGCRIWTAINKFGCHGKGMEERRKEDKGLGRGGERKGG